MKKQLLLLAGGLLALASCNTATDGGASDAQIDSMVNAKVEEIRMDMMRQNDSLINAMAQIKADSIIAAMKGGSAVTTKTTTTRTTKVTGSSTSTQVKDQPAAEEPRSNAPQNVNDRTGATRAPQNVNDRSGAKKEPQNVNDRTGGK